MRSADPQAFESRMARQRVGMLALQPKERVKNAKMSFL